MIAPVQTKEFTYEVDTDNAVSADEAEAIVESPYVYVLTAGDENILHAFELESDMYMVWSEEGECLVFAYDTFSNDTYDLMIDLGIQYDLTDREQLAVVA